jgi:hypothetical protein
MTIAAALPPPPSTQPTQPLTALISLILLGASFLLTLYTHTTCPTSNSHTPCTTLNNFILGLAVLLAYLSAVRFYTSPDGKPLFPLMVLCRFGVLARLAWFGVDDLRAGLSGILGVEVVVRVWCGWRDGMGDGWVGDEEAGLVGGTKGCVEPDGTTGGGEDAVLGQVPLREEKGDGRVDTGDGVVPVVAESKTAPSS